jgi:FixJ family two-component response regulator
MPPADSTAVAIIDDDESLCRSLGRVLRQSGFHPYVFLSARDFLESPDRTGLRCLLIDIQLGDASGIDLHRRLLATGDAPPVIYITAHTDPAVRSEAQSLGCAGFFLKTDPASAIVEVLRRVTAAA